MRGQFFSINDKAKPIHAPEKADVKQTGPKKVKIKLKNHDTNGLSIFQHRVVCVTVDKATGKFKKGTDHREDVEKKKGDVLGAIDKDHTPKKSDTEDTFAYISEVIYSDPDEKRVDFRRRGKVSRVDVTLT